MSKIKQILLALGVFTSIGGCANQELEVEMTPVRSIEEAVKQIESHEGSPSEFTLVIPDSLNDATGINMTIITDKILGRGWVPDGFSQKNGYRIYRYKAMD